MGSKKNTAGGVLTPVISGILAFFLSLSFLGITVLAVVKCTFFSGKFIGSILDQSYFDAVFEEIKSDAYDYTIPTDIDTAVLEGVFDGCDVGKDVRGFAAVAFNDGEYVPDLQSLEAALDKNVTAFFESKRDEAVTDDVESIKKSYIEQIEDVYIDDVTVPGIELIKKLHRRFDRIFAISLSVCAGISLVLIGVLTGIHRKTPHRAFRYFAYASGGTALMMFAAPFYAYVSRFYETLNVAPESFYRFLLAYIKRGLEVCMGAAAAWLVVMAVCIVLVGVIRKKKSP